LNWKDSPADQWATFCFYLPSKCMDNFLDDLGHDGVLLADINSKSIIIIELVSLEKLSSCQQLRGLKKT